MNKTFKKYLDRDEWREKENSNMSFSLQGLNNHIASEATKKYWLDEVYPKSIGDLHRGGFFHIHDLGSLSSYCVGWDIKDLLLTGFTGVAGKLTAAPAKHFGTALGQVVNFIYTLQGESAGAQAFSNFDTYLAPFIREDWLSYEQVHQELQEFMFNMNVPTRTGFQSPFSNVTIDVHVPKNMKEDHIIIGGEYQEAQYGDFQAEMDIFNRAFCEVLIEGDAQNRIFTFPIPTYNIGKDFNWDSEKNDKLWEMTAKYGIPYFANFINSDMDPEDARSMAILGSQRVIYKNGSGRVTINEIRHMVERWESKDAKPTYKMLMDGDFVDVVDMFTVPYDKEDYYYKLTFENGYTQNFSNYHKCAIIRDGVFCEEEVQNLTDGDKFLFSKNAFEGDEKAGDQMSGLILGYYLGEGWKRSGGKSEINFAINIEKKDYVDAICLFFGKFGCKCRVKKQEDVKIFKVFVYGKQAVGFVEQFISGNKAIEKRLTEKVWNSSIEFRRGLLEGLYRTDGHRKTGNLFHTTNKKLCEDLIILANSVGEMLRFSENKKNTRYFKKDKSDLETFTSYNLHFTNIKDVFNLDGENYSVVDVSSVEKCFSKSDKVYNFTVNTERHLYELPNGAITHQCCRLRLDNRELRSRGGGLFGANPLTGSIGVVTINMPKIGYLEYKRGDFFAILSGLMDGAKDSLEIKRKVLEKFTNEDLYPYTKFYLRDVAKKNGQYWLNHFSTIGLVGMNECCENFLGCSIAEKTGHDFAVEVLEFMRDRIRGYQEETGNLYNLEASPAEGVAYRLARKDKDEFSDIITAGEDEPYYTNSVHLPVTHTEDIFEILDHQDDLQTKFTGGTVVHAFLGEQINDPNMAKLLVKKMAENYKLPYFSITPTFSICPICGYIAGEHEFCPNSHTKEQLQKIGLDK